MECFIKRYDATAPRGERGQLHGILVGLCAGVHHEEAIRGIAANAAKLLGDLFLDADAHRVRVEAKLRHLVSNGCNVVGVTVSDGDHSMTSV